MTTLLRARLYTRPGCHLCDEAVGELRRLQAAQPHELELVDISADDELQQRYGERIPVLEIDGREYSAPLPRAVLERALREATMR